MTDTKTPSPSDAEIAALYLQETGFDINDSPAALLDFARAVLARWGQPQAVAGGDLVACTYGDNGYACCEGGPCQAELHNEKIAAPPPQAVREPREMTQLEYERLQAISLDYSDSEDECTGFRDGWRAAEKHHGITKGGQHGAE